MNNGNEKKTSLAQKKGLPPGTAVFVGEVKVEETTLSLFKYNKEEYHVKELTLKDLNDVPERDAHIQWLNINGLHQTQAIEQVCKKWKINKLVIEDIVNTNHRPKIEIYEDYVFLITKMYYYNSEKKTMLIEQVSFVLTGNTVISFQERPGDIFGSIRERIKLDNGRIRRSGADYLLYSLLDCLVDNYFVLLEKIAEDLEECEESVFSENDPNNLSSFFYLKRTLLLLRKSVWPLREMTSMLYKGEVPLIKESTMPYLRDLYEHVIQVIDSVETYRDVANGLTELQMSLVNHRMNEVMKVLTVCASIFIPLTFLAGIYGMNFEYMPELKIRDGYFILLGVMAVISVFMLMLFKRKKWL